MLSTKLILTVKKNAEGEITRYKAQVVARGDRQKEGIDYGETFAPVVRYDVIRLMVALCNRYGLTMDQINAVTAFLNSKLSEIIYMKLPEGTYAGHSKFE